MNKHIFIFCILFSTFINLMGQSNIDLFDQSVQNGHIMMTDTNLIHRREASLNFDKNFIQLLQSDLKDSIVWDSLSMISRLKTDDNQYSIYSWQIFDDNFMRYRFVLQTQDSIIAILKNDLPTKSINEYDTYLTEEWPGGLVYNIQDIHNDQGHFLALFLYNYGFGGVSYKYIELLPLDIPLAFEFGAPVFLNEEGDLPNGLFRYVLKYNNQARVKLNYDAYWDIILFDHLIEAQSNYGRGEQTKMVPDGSYEGFRIKKGYFVHTDKVFDKVLNDAPRPQPVLNKKESKNIFGH